MIKSSKAYFAAILIVLAAILWGLSSSLSHGPKAKAADVPSDQFSAMRAFADLEDMVGNNKPHPSGSAENARVRDLIKSKFEALGYDVNIQSALGCTVHYPGCTAVDNIIVRLSGSGGGDVILVTTHYDSVPAGPAAADDGAGTAAILEIARILKAAPQMKNDVIFLITDGEEGGLRGASAFANQHEDYEDVKLVINMESRGVSGPSAMFETGSGNLQLVKTFASNNPHPIATSLAYEVYQRIPNDTDYSIYKDKGTAGLNFAFTGDVHLYHSRYDDVDHLDKTSLQHHGDNALFAIRAFGDEDLNTLIGETNASYIDVFGQFLLVWSSSLNIPLAILCLILLGFVCVKARPRPSEIIESLAAVASIIILTIMMGFVLSYPLGRWPDLFYLDHPYPWVGRIALLFGAIFVSWGVARIFATRVSYMSLVWASTFIMSLFALIIAIAVPGVAYVFLIPALSVSLGLIIDTVRKHDRPVIAAHIGIALGAYMAFYHFFALEVVAHYKFSYLRIAPLVILGFVLAPLFLRTEGKTKTPKSLGICFAIITVAASVVSVFIPGFNAKHPIAHNLVYMDGFVPDEAIWASETSGNPGKPFLNAAGFDTKTPAVNHYKVLWGGAFAKPAPTNKFPTPEYAYQGGSVKDGVWTIELDVKSSNNGYGLLLGFGKDNPPEIVHINGRLAADYSITKRKLMGKPMTIRGAGLETYRVTITTSPGQDFTMVLVDAISLTPDELDGMAQMRSDIAAPLHSGDRALIATPIVISCSDHCVSAENQ